MLFTLTRYASSILYIAGNTLISDNNHRNDYYLAIPQLRLPVLFHEYEMQTFPEPSKISTMNNSYIIILFINPNFHRISNVIKY